MKYDPIKKQLFTDNGLLIKNLNCPIKMNWENLKSNNGNKFRTCSECEKSVIDTDFYSDNELYKIMQENPNLCLKVSLNQKNVRLISGKNYDR